ncbi:MAG TPA: hypothetical protein PKL54_15770 [Candidatus Hydrogenedentes bacterium]|nr:hypothetical protein [Candidatus Hydrogenedentota bacterium]HQL95668.1 hypothetical protein [Candidatus Hydrogenedentota bacterium]
MDIRGTKLFQRLHEWLAREPVYKLMREDRDSLVKDMRVIADAVCGKPDMRPGELLLKISDLKAEAAFGRGCLEHGHALGVDPAASAAGETFISALTFVVGAGDPERFLSSFESLNPGLLERVRPSLVLHDDAAKVCPNCDGTGWSYHEHLPIERNVGCEDCGGCGDERGTGIIP